MIVADYIIQRLADLGIKHVFQVYGSASAPLVDAFSRITNIKYICTFTEQCAAFAAEGYAKVSGNFGVCLTTSGPGIQNAFTGICNCYYDSVPVLFISGQVNSRFIRPNNEVRQVGFQEMPIIDCVKPVTKYAVQVRNPDHIVCEFDKLIYLMREGRPGPVLLDIPIDVQKAEINLTKQKTFQILKTEFNKDTIFRQIQKYIGDLQNSQRPGILVGGGIRTADAVNELFELSKILKVPYYPTWNALDIITSDWECYGGRIGTYGGAGRNFGIQNTDLLLCLGTRISGRITGGNVESFTRGAKRYLVDIDQALLRPENQQVHIHENIYCNVKNFVYYLRTLIENHPLPNFSPWLDKVRSWKDKYDPVDKRFYRWVSPVHPYVFMRELSKLMTSKDVLVADCGGNIVVTNHAFETKFGQRYFTNNGNSPMGFSMCGALGAYLAKSPESGNVVCIIGDGGATMNIQELQTLLNYDIRIKVFILNNHIYGITKGFQKSNKLAELACGPDGYKPPDFVWIGQAFGVKTFKFYNNNIEELHQLMREVLDFDGPALVDVDCHEFHSYLPKIDNWQAPIEEQFPYLSREELESNMYIKPTEFSKTLQ